MANPPNSSRQDKSSDPDPGNAGRNGPEWWPGPSFTEYEAGKKRRYELLFAVNGGAFALARFLLEESSPTGSLAAFGTFGLDRTDFSVAMVFFNVAMFADIFAFGNRAAFFKKVGKIVLFVICLSLVSAWMMVGGLPALMGVPGGLAERLVALLVSVIVLGAVYQYLVSLPFEEIDLRQIERRKLALTKGKARGRS